MAHQTLGVMSGISRSENASSTLGRVSGVSLGSESMVFGLRFFSAGTGSWNARHHIAAWAIGKQSLQGYLERRPATLAGEPVRAE